jgi:hypothetical protein
MNGEIGVVALWLADILLAISFSKYNTPFRLPNKWLSTVGISRQRKWEALVELEHLGLISIERRPRKSPVVRVHTEPPPRFQSHLARELSALSD